MSARPKLWAATGLAWVGELDYGVPQFDVEWLEDASKELMAASGKPPAPALLYNVAVCLHRMAESRTALRALNRYRRNQAPPALYGLNVAVHLAASSELQGRKRALNHVAAAWDREPNTVEDYRTDHGEAAAEKLEQLVESRRKHGIGRNAVLQQIDADMCQRAKLPWFTRRKKKRAAAPRRRR